jgi:hypothetical protein
VSELLRQCSENLKVHEGQISGIVTVSHAKLERIDSELKSQFNVSDNHILRIQ